MWRVSLRNLLVGKLRLFLTVMAVTVGVAFVSGTFVLSDTMGKAFDQLYAGLTSGTDVIVKAKNPYDLDITNSAQVKPLDAGLLAVISRVPGVEVARGGVAGFALVLDKHGKPMQPGGAPTIGASVSGDAQLASGFTFRTGRAPRNGHELVLDAASARKAGYVVGDRVDVVLQDSRRSFTLVGIVGFGDTDNLAGATLAGFDLATAQQVLGKVGKYDEIDVKARPGVDAAQLRDAVAKVLPHGVEAKTGTQVAADGSAAVRQAMGIFTKVLLVFAGVSLLVGSFVIWNTFNVLVAQRRRDVALLRAVGATGRQILGGILIEATTIGLVAGGIGIAAGVLLAAGIRGLLSLVGVEVPSTSPALEPRTVVAGFCVGVGVTLVAALAPAWSATRVAPMEALRAAVPATAGIGSRRRNAGWALIGLGAAGLIACIVIGNQPWWTGAATLACFAGLVTAGPVLARATAAVAAHGRRGGGWRLSARNVARNARRSAATALALTIGLTVVSAAAVTAASMRASVSQTVAGANRADLILQPAGVGSGVSASVAPMLARRTDVARVVEFRSTGAQVEGHNMSVVGVSPAGLTNVLDLGIRSGDAARLGPGTVLLGVQRARQFGVRVGDTIHLLFPEAGRLSLRVAGTFTQESFLGSNVVISLPDFAARVSSRLDSALMIDAAPGVSTAALKSALVAAVAQYPNVQVSDAADLTRKAQDSVNQLLGLVTALLLLAVVVALLGIVNTLVLSVVERTRELGLMRAVGATRRQVRGQVRREAVLMSTLGALSGVALGGLAGVALSRALADQGINTIAVPTSTLAAYLVVAALVGTVAAIGPARRASKVDVLRAVTTE